MKLRYVGSYTKSGGFLVLESEPQMRNLFVISETSNTNRFALPYLYFVVKYRLVGNQFVYGGLSDYGLHVFGSLTRLSSFDDSIFYLPTDYKSRGVVCTNHKFDSTAYKSLEQLVNTIIPLWYGHYQYVEYNPFSKPWKKITLDELSNGKWENAGSLRNQIGRYLIDATIDATSDSMIDESWPPEKLILPQLPEVPKPCGSPEVESTPAMDFNEIYPNYYDDDPYGDSYYSNEY